MTTQLAKQDVEVSGGMVKFNTVSEMIQVSTILFESGYAPSCHKSAKAVFAVLQQGAELGLRPMQSLQGLYSANGHVGIMDKCARGLALSSGKAASIDDRFEGSNDDLTAICTIHRFMQGMTQTAFTGRFSVADAKRAGLWGKAGPWTNYPKDMLSHKASARALNAGFADVLIGLPVFEDIQDLPPERKLSENPNPVEDPLMKQVPSIRQLMEQKANNPTRDGASMTGEENGTYEGTNSQSVLPEQNDDQASTSEPIEIHPDDLDYQKSVSESQPSASPVSADNRVHEALAGAQSVTGDMIVYPPKKDSKQPWNIVVAGVKMAVWPKTLPGIVQWLEKGNTGKGKKWRADYTSEQKGQYTNNTCVHLEAAK